MEGMRLMKYFRTFALAVLAGIAIGIGGIVFLSLENKVVGALMFTVGLYTICIHGLNLYTGKVGYLIGIGQPVSYLVELLIIWAGNLLGTWAAAMAASSSRIAGIRQAAVTMCEAKLNDGLVSLFLLGVFCGFLMYVAVDGYKSAQNPAILFLGVASFILCGFEHCIADMFYFSLAGAWSGRAITCIFVITLGNSAGGALIPLVKKITYGQ